MSDLEMSAPVATEAPAQQASTPVIDATIPQQPTGAWFDSIKDDGLRGYVESKGYKGIEDVITSQQAYEKIIGAEKAGKTLIMPSEDATPEQYAEFYNKLGRPEKATDYGIKAPEGLPPEFANETAGWMHEAGLNKQQANALAEKYNAYAANQAAQQAALYEQAQERDNAALKEEWGGNYDRNIELARRATRAFGLDNEQAAKIQAAIGAKEMAKLFSNIGNGFGEHALQGGNQGSPFGMSVEAARVRLAEIKSSADLRTKYLSKDPTLVNEMNTLNRVIAGGR
jgi:hypothetical protein